MVDCYYCGRSTNAMYKYTKIPVCLKCALKQFKTMVRKDPTYKGTFFKYLAVVDRTVYSPEEVDKYLRNVNSMLADFFSQD